MGIEIATSLNPHKSDVFHRQPCSCYVQHEPQGRCSLLQNHEIPKAVKQQWLGRFGSWIGWWLAGSLVDSLSWLNSGGWWIFLAIWSMPPGYVASWVGLTAAVAAWHVQQTLAVHRWCTPKIRWRNGDFLGATMKEPLTPVGWWHEVSHCQARNSWWFCVMVLPRLSWRSMNTVIQWQHMATILLSQ